MLSEKDKLLAVWRVNTPAFIREIAINPQMAMMRAPLQIFQGLIGEIAERASQLNDPVLNGLMAQLALYEVCDPYSKEFDQSTCNRLIEEKERHFHP